MCQEKQQNSICLLDLKDNTILRRQSSVWVVTEELIETQTENGSLDFVIRWSVSSYVVVDT